MAALSTMGAATRGGRGPQLPAAPSRMAPRPQAARKFCFRLLSALPPDPLLHSKSVEQARTAV